MSRGPKKRVGQKRLGAKRSAKRLKRPNPKRLKTKPLSKKRGVKSPPQKELTYQRLPPHQPMIINFVTNVTVIIQSPTRNGTENAAPALQAAIQKIKVLFLAANPRSRKNRLKLDEEAREIEEKINAAEHGGSIEFMTKWATRPKDLLSYLNKHKPHVVHFSGHGSPTEEIVLLNDQGKPELVSKEDLVSLFHTLKDNIRVVFLNACFTRPQAEAITKEIDCAIGMTRAIGDDTAIIFAASFYSAIGFGRSIQNAFDQGKLAIRFAKIAEENTPVLMCRDTITAQSIVLIDFKKTDRL